jgi:hypothetical protein
MGEVIEQMFDRLPRASRAYSVYYIYDPDDNPQGWGGTDCGGWSEAMLQALDYKTGKIRWSHKWEGGGSAIFIREVIPGGTRSTRHRS